MLDIVENWLKINFLNISQNPKVPQISHSVFDEQEIISKEIKSLLRKGSFYGIRWFYFNSFHVQKGRWYLQICSEFEAFKWLYCKQVFKNEIHLGYLQNNKERCVDGQCGP